MILLIDNYDSFTYNLYQQIESLGSKTIVKENDKISIREIKKLSPSHIVISPGPGTPRESGISPQIIKEFYSKLPILGVCLGHQAIAEVFGSKTVRAKYVLHGKVSNIINTGKNLFEGTKKTFKVARYHSLIIDKVPHDFNLDAYTDKNEIMAITHKKYPLYGIQFHPESFLTEEGNKIMKNFLKR